MTEDKHLFLQLESDLNPFDKSERIYTFFYATKDKEDIAWCQTFKMKEDESFLRLMNRAAYCLLDNPEVSDAFKICTGEK